MALETSQISEILKNSRSSFRAGVSRAVNQEQRLRLHIETAMSKGEASPHLNQFLQVVEKILPSDKFRSFETMMKFPLSTTTLTERIFTALEKLFDGRNPVFDYDFTSPDDLQDWEVYRSDNLDEPTFWKTTAFETMKTAINSIAVVDLPSEQKNEKPEPYLYFLNISNVIHFELAKDNVFDWIIFKQDNDRIAVFCDGWFRVLKMKKGSLSEIAGVEVETAHDLGYCPARFFWSTQLNQRDPVVKKSPLSNFLGKLDSLLFYEIANEDLQIYARYPIYSGYSSDCDFQIIESGISCQGGYLHNGSEYVMNGSSPSPCPICDRKKLNGPGSFVEFDPPSRANDHADLRNPVQVTTIDRSSLDYNNEDIASRVLSIYTSVTGYQGGSINDKAVNEKQVLAMFESLEAALKTPQNNIEAVWEWSNATICRLRYGNESFQNASISLGTEHYIMTPSQIMEMYSYAKASSFSVSTLDMLEDRYFATEFRNNPERLFRQQVLTNLDPFRHLSIEEVTKMYEKKMIRFEEYMIKVNFSSFVMKFERENTSVTEFGIKLSFEKKIDAITKELIRYAEEVRPEIVASPFPSPVMPSITEN